MVQIIALVMLVIVVFGAGSFALAWLEGRSLRMKIGITYAVIGFIAFAIGGPPFAAAALLALSLLAAWTAASLKRQVELDKKAQVERKQQQAEEFARRDHQIFSALSAFPQHWAAELFCHRPGWGGPNSKTIADQLGAPDVIVRCGQDPDVQLYRRDRVRAVEGGALNYLRKRRAAELRQYRREARERAREQEIEERAKASRDEQLSRQIIVDLDDLERKR